VISQNGSQRYPRSRLQCNCSRRVPLWPFFQAEINQYKIRSSKLVYRYLMGMAGGSRDPVVPKRDFQRCKLVGPVID
jgi:hypothetical protein